MNVYAVRKRRGQWAVCAEENVVLQFDSYDEAIQTARAAVEVLAARVSRQTETHMPVQTGNGCAVMGNRR